MRNGVQSRQKETLRNAENILQRAVAQDVGKENEGGRQGEDTPNLETTNMCDLAGVFSGVWSRKGRKEENA